METNMDDEMRRYGSNQECIEGKKEIWKQIRMHRRREGVMKGNKDAQTERRRYGRSSEEKRSSLEKENRGSEESE